MTRKDFILKIQQMEPAVRAEYDLTQEKMAHAIGISKKSLVEMEKGRVEMGWAEAVALSAVFSGSQVLNGAFGGSPMDYVSEIALLGMEAKTPEKSFARIWWTEIESNEYFSIEQNIITSHYRLSFGDERILSSFEYNAVKNKMDELTYRMRNKGK